MGLLDEIGKEALMAALFQPTTTTYMKDSWTPDGSHYTEPAVHQSPSIMESIASSVTTQAVRDDIKKAMTDHLIENPELLINILAKRAVQDLLSGQIDVSHTMKDLVREKAAEILGNSDQFKERVMDMSGLSDSDKIDIRIELKPMGQ